MTCSLCGRDLTELAARSKWYVRTLEHGSTACDDIIACGYRVAERKRAEREAAGTDETPQPSLPVKPQRYHGD